MIQPVSAFFAFLSLLSNDPLFTKMVGHWHAEGERKYVFSGRTATLKAEVETGMDSDSNGEFLVSKNLWTEVEFNGDVPSAPAQYTRVYWMRLDPHNPRQYLLGYGDSGQVQTTAATGIFDGQTLKVRQTVRGNPPIIVDSVTSFFENSSVYKETTLHGDTTLTETEVRYGRAQ